MCGYLAKPNLTRSNLNQYIEVVAARAVTAGSEHGAEGGAVGLGLVRRLAKKPSASLGYASHQRPRSGKWMVLHPVTARETRPSYQFRAAP